ncbi:helix-turn-helix domain-containing protein [Stappia indica]|uniref:Helix-turn-helix domain-containing protein n=1 Tax=Stappia indica TaxID=538381 RepID=A0A857C4Y1_9HYPH|nr:helix-turn-helix domain-containing protein [Stappia indica]QGZ33929.1 helix-turn-helix domain-containing protein [Stappia indica]
MTPVDLREIRSKLGLNQAGLAAVLGRHPQTISKWERGAEPIPETGELRLALAALLAGLEPVS